MVGWDGRWGLFDLHHIETNDTEVSLVRANNNAEVTPWTLAVWRILSDCFYYSFGMTCIRTVQYIHVCIILVLVQCIYNTVPYLINKLNSEQQEQPVGQVAGILVNRKVDPGKRNEVVMAQGGDKQTRGKAYAALWGEPKQVCLFFFPPSFSF